MKVSVIVAAYNCERTLEDSLNTILTQDFDDFEVIVVDDGSTDRTAVICDRLAKDNTIVRVIHQENKGVAMARQAGLDAAIGEYTIHFDSDDTAEQGMLRELYEMAAEKDLDILVADYFTDAPGKSPLRRNQEIRDSRVEEVVYDMVSGRLMGSLCNKLIKRKLFTEGNIHFSAGINYCEDALILLRLLLAGNLNIGYIKKAYYHYRLNESSITHKVSRRAYEGLKKYHEEIQTLLPDTPRFKRIKEEYGFAPFEAALQNDLFKKGEMRRELKKLKPYIFKYKKRKRLLGYLVLTAGMYGLGKKLLAI